MKLLDRNLIDEATKKKWYDLISILAPGTPRKYIIQKPPFEELRTAFTFSERKETNEPVPENLSKEIFIRHLVTQGGYHGFFKPDLDEVITVLSTEMSLTPMIERIFLWTTIGSPEFNKCDVTDEECHTGVTIVQIQYKDEYKNEKEKE